MACIVCPVGGINTGLPSSYISFGATNREFLMKLYADDGTRNGFDLSSEITQAQLTALINNEDASKRLYPVVQAENYTSERGESSFEEAPSGRRVKTRKGDKVVSYEVWEVGSYYLKQIIGAECKGYGVFRVDECGNLQGDAATEGFLYPVPIEDGSMDIRLVDATQEATSKVMLSYQLARRFQDENLGVVLAEDFEDGVDLLGESGLVPLDGKDMSASAASQEVVASLFAPYSSAVTGEPFRNLIAADFELFNATGSTTTAPDTAVESPDGTYTLTFPLATFIATDVLTLKVIKDGINDYDLQQSTIVAGA